MLDKLKSALDAAFDRIAREFTEDDISVLMPTYSPSQGRLLSEFNRVGGRSAIAGGKRNTPMFANVPQHGLDFDTTAHINMFPPGMSEKIVGALPDDLLRDRKVAVFSFIPPPETWERHIADRGLGTEVVASNEQNTRLFFENKGNLVHILKECGLDAYIIPTEVVDATTPERKLRETYNRIRNENGKVVVQSCIENYEPTRFIDNEADFMAHVRNSAAPCKTTRFVEGNEANLSFFAANTRPADTGRGVTKCNLPLGLDVHNPASLALIEAHAAEKGIDASNVVSITGRATLKVVGDILLANEPGDSVGNNIGHIYDENTSRQITEIGAKLGRKMALCGKVGHAGADLIIDRGGKIWINEINDRQQGPTDQMSADAEAAGLPGLSRLSWFCHYADFKKPENANLLAAISDNADAIHQKYLTSPGSFYVKAFATHAASHDGEIRAQRDLPPGIYNITRDQDGDWRWEQATAGTKMQPVDLASGQLTLKISSGGLARGDSPPSGAEMFRITGMAEGENAPFIIKDGMSCLNPAWRPMLEQLYADCFGEDYTGKNPQHQLSVRKSDNDKVPTQAPAMAPRKAA